uniref:DUF3707 domain-containing protein n=1 Tax=Macrostomum lignano TaxID=282301 RepID=A0A1I8F6R6_9PLAT
QRWRQAAPGFPIQFRARRRQRDGQNWFYKIASIRASCYPGCTLKLPLLPCYRFVDDRFDWPGYRPAGRYVPGIAAIRLLAALRPLLPGLGKFKLAPCLPALDWLVLSLASTSRRSRPAIRFAAAARREPCLLAACLAALPPELIAEESVAIGNAVASRQVPQSCCPILVQLLGDSLTQASASWPIPRRWRPRNRPSALLNSAWGAVRSANPRPDELHRLRLSLGVLGSQTCLQRNLVRVEAACCVLDAYMPGLRIVAKTTAELASTGSCSSAACLCTDSLTGGVSLKDDFRRATTLPICCLRVQPGIFGSDFQRQLDFLVDCRAAFGHLRTRCWLTVISAAPHGSKNLRIHSRAGAAFLSLVTHLPSLWRRKPDCALSSSTWSQLRLALLKSAAMG